MKKRLIISSLILSSGFALAGSTYADTSTTEDYKSPPGFSELSESDHTTLESLTGSDRDAFLESKGITRPTESGSGRVENTRRTLPKNSSLRNNINNSGSTSTLGDVTSTTRASRLAANQEKTKQQKIAKIQKKVNAGESLTRLEKKFATANNIEY